MPSNYSSTVATPRCELRHLSRRDRLIVAWHEVPGITPPQRAVPQVSDSPGSVDHCLSRVTRRPAGYRLEAYSTMRFGVSSDIPWSA
jgi:hypothetical protein